MKAEMGRSGRKKPRIVLTSTDLNHLFKMHGTRSVKILAKRTGLPYAMIYNLVHRRVRSISHRHYPVLFGDPAPQQVSLKTDGAVFRNMVGLWLFLHDGLTKAALFRELLAMEGSRRIDHRIFSGKTQAVPVRLEHLMRQKFAEAGVDEPLLNQWLDEFSVLSHEDRVPYASIRPVLMYLKDKIGVAPTSVLNQSLARYETGMLQSVSRSVADRAEALQQKAQRALGRDRALKPEKIKEMVAGPNPSHTLYADIREELLFLCRSTNKGVKTYLGRSLWTYEKGKAKRIAKWRALKIFQDCERLIQQRPGIALADLPKSLQRSQIQNLIGVLVARSTQLLLEKGGVDFEKKVLEPSYARRNYHNPVNGFTPFELAPRALGMNRRAFDMMVAKHCDIFRSIGKFAQRWYLPDMYLKELSRKQPFGLIMVKYEWLAKHRVH